MIEMQVGQIVFSKAGRDKKEAFVIIAIEGEYAYLSDGDIRKLSKPKKKKFKHIQPTNHVELNIKEKSINSSLLDSDIRKSLVQYETKIKKSEV